MSNQWPDLYDERKVEPVLCPECFRKTHHALNTDRYVCPTHGPVWTGDLIYANLLSRADRDAC